MRTLTWTAAALAAGFLMAAPTWAARYEGRVVEMDRDAQTLTVQMDDGRTASVSTEGASFGAQADWSQLAQGDRVVIDARETPAMGEAEAGRATRADRADAAQKPDLDEDTFADGKPYNRLGVMGGEGADLRLQASRIDLAQNAAPADTGSRTAAAPTTSASQDDAMQDRRNDAMQGDRANDTRMASRLPDTAGPLPLMLLLGGLGLGGGFALRRTRMRS